jgi:hypothetical protein
MPKETCPTYNMCYFSHHFKSCKAGKQECQVLVGTWKFDLIASCIKNGLKKNLKPINIFLSINYDKIQQAHHHDEGSNIV